MWGPSSGDFFIKMTGLFTTRSAVIDYLQGYKQKQGMIRPRNKQKKPKMANSGSNQSEDSEPS